MKSLLTEWRSLLDGPPRVEPSLPGSGFFKTTNTEAGRVPDRMYPRP
jgi:hypothetical protein